MKKKKKNQSVDKFLIQYQYKLSYTIYQSYIVISLKEFVSSGSCYHNQTF